HRLEGKLQAARQHRGRKFLRVGGGQQKLDVGRRLFQRLEQRIETAGGKHVYFVNEVHLVASLSGCVLHVVEQLAGVFHLGARSGIDFNQVDESPLVNGTTAVALTTRRGSHAVASFALGGTVEALGQNSCQRGF